MGKWHRSPCWLFALCLLFRPHSLAGYAEPGAARQLLPGRQQIVPLAVSRDAGYLVSVSGNSGAMSLIVERPGRAPSRLLRGTHANIVSVFVRQDNHQVLFSTTGPKGAMVHTVALDGSGEIEIATFPEYSALVITDLSPDGKNVAALVWAKGPPQIALLSMEDRTARLLYRTSEWILAGKTVLFSPDGKYMIACRRMESAPGTWEGRRRQIIRIDIPTGAVTALINEAEDLYPIGWTPDGSDLMFARDRFDSTELVLQSIKNGVAAGPASLLRSDLGRVSPVALTKTGALVYYSTPLKADVYLGDLDLNRGTLGNARPATKSSPGSHRWAFWSEDGQYLVLSSRRRAGNPNHLFNRLSVVHPPGETQDLPALSDAEGGFYSWRPDGSLLVIGNRADLLQMYRVTPPSWSLMPLGPLKGREHDLGFPVFGPDKIMYYRTDNPEVIMARTLETSEDRILVRLPEKTYARSMRLSPDGKQLAFILVDAVGSNGKWQAIMTVGVDGQRLREMYRLDAPERLQPATGQGLAWSYDSRGVLFTKGKSPDYDLFYLPVAGGDARQIRVDVQGEAKIRATYPWMDMSPDRKTLAFGHGVDLEPQLWVLEGILRPNHH